MLPADKQKAGKTFRKTCNYVYKAKQLPETSP